MDSQKVEQLIMLHASKFPPESLPILREKLSNADYTQATMLFSQLKDPMIALILSVCIGSWGVDRFYIGSVGIGLGKLLTCGGACIWWVIDCFMIQDATRQKNLEMLMMYLR